jgi:hypothetical protein
MSGTYIFFGTDIAYFLISAAIPDVSLEFGNAPPETGEARAMNRFGSLSFKKAEEAPRARHRRRPRSLKRKRGVPPRQGVVGWGISRVNPQPETALDKALEALAAMVVEEEDRMTTEEFFLPPPIWCSSLPKTKKLNQRRF